MLLNTKKKFVKTSYPRVKFFAKGMIFLSGVEKFYRMVKKKLKNPTNMAV